MKIVALSAILSGVFALTACGSSSSATNGNFAKVINKHFADNCVTLTPQTSMVEAKFVKKYPAQVAQVQGDRYSDAKYIAETNERLNAGFDALVSAGVLSVTPGTVKRMHTDNIFKPEKETDFPARVYALTTVGKQALKDKSGGGLSFCAGTYHVDEVVRFTQPAVVEGVTGSNVVFLASAVNVPEWAKTEAVRTAFPRAAKELSAKKEKQHASLILANDGWIDDRDFH